MRECESVNRQNISEGSNLKLRIMKQNQNSNKNQTEVKLKRNLKLKLKSETCFFLTNKLVVRKPN